MTKPKVSVAITTTHGQMQSQFITTLMQLFANRKFDMALWHYVDPYIVLARNCAAADFLKSDCTHLMFMDADILDPQCAEHIERMLGHDEAIVGGLYPKKQEDKLTWVCNALPDRPEEDDRNLLSLRHIGTGFLLIKREVFEAMIDAYGPGIRYYEDESEKPLYDFFDMPRQPDAEGKVRKVSEDWHFCNTARKLGFKVYGDTKVLLMHIGTAVYPLKHLAKRDTINLREPERKTERVD